MPILAVDNFEIRLYKPAYLPWISNEAFNLLPAIDHYKSIAYVIS
ncbi:MAG: hypothetical protein QM731_28450 [Chitinophagaceae bacterium]